MSAEIQVVLLRDVPEERKDSMERFADELERELVASRGATPRGFAVHQSPLAARVGLGAVDSYVRRFAWYPIRARFIPADVYHVVDHGYAHVSALLPTARTVVTCHDLMLLRAAEGHAGFTPSRRSLLRFRWTTSFLRRVAHVVCDSEATRADVVRLIGVDPARTSVIPLGVDRRFRVLDSQRRARVAGELRGNDDHVALHVSTGPPYKNVPATLRVLAAVRDAGLRLALARVGVPLSGDELTLARELGVEGHVRELGRVDDERLVELYNAADLLLFPSHLEGYGFPVLEAMACGTPVVASTAPSLLEVGGDAILSAAPTDIESLATAVAAVLSSPALAADLRARGLARAAGFTWSETAAAYASIYTKVFEAARRGRPARRLVT